MADPTEPLPDSPALVKLTIGGQDYEVAPEVHTAITRAVDTLNGRWSAQKQALETRVQELEASATTEEPEDASDDESPYRLTLPQHDLVLNRPDVWQQQLGQTLEGALQRLDERNDARVIAAIRELDKNLGDRETQRQIEDTKATMLAETQESFYHDHEDLRPHAALVEGVLDEVYDEVRQMAPRQAYEHAAKVLREKHLQALTPKEEPSRFPRLLQGGRSAPARAVERATAPRTMQDLQSARQAKLRRWAPSGATRR